jgi:branched-chain amino acid transport system ATP-binding protein
MLRLEDVTVRFGGLTALKDVSFAMGAGEILGLVGPNGAGKTTLFNTISGLVRPKTGRILFAEREIGRLPLHARARLGLGRTFQIPQPMHHLTVRENLTVAQVFGAGKADAARVDEILEVMELGQHAERNAATELALQELKRYKLAIVIVEHDIETISTLCSRAVVLNFGQMIADGTPAEVFRNPAVVESYTGAADA